MAKKLALIIGIENYCQTSGLIRVLYAKNDAQAMADYAQQAGFSLISGKPLLDQEASYSEVIRQLRFMFHHSRPDDFLLLYYAGHGYFSEGGGYLMPFDYQKGKGIDESSCISFASFNKRFENQKTKRFIFFLDTCHSGFAVEQVGIRGPGSAVSPRAREKIEQQMKEMLKSNESYRNVGRVIFTSSISTENSYHIRKFKHGLFTYYLLSALEMKQGKNVINVEDLIRQVKDDVLDYCKNNGLEQTPHAYTNIQGRFLIPAYKRKNTDTSSTSARSKKSERIKTGRGKTIRDENRIDPRYFDHVKEMLKRFSGNGEPNSQENPAQD
jgi:uncharacterized caspase-like protein